MSREWTDADKRWSGESEATIKYYEALRERAEKAEQEVERLKQEMDMVYEDGFEDGYNEGIRDGVSKEEE